MEIQASAIKGEPGPFLKVPSAVTSPAYTLGMA
jgi:hypothetical protein